MEFKVGDRVRFKTWEEMKTEFGLNGGSIACKFHFTPEMDNLIDREREYLITGIRDEKITFEDLPRTYSYSEDMIKLADECTEEKSNNLLWKKLTIDLFKEDFLGGRIYHSVSSRGKGVLNLIGAIALKTIAESSEDYKARIETCTYNNNARVLYDHFCSNSNEYKLIILRNDDYTSRRLEFLDEKLMSQFGITVLREGENYLFLYGESSNLILCLCDKDGFSYSDTWIKDCIELIIEKFPFAKDETLNQLLLEDKHKEAIDYITNYYNSCQELMKRNKFDRFLRVIEKKEKEEKENNFYNEIERKQNRISELESDLERAYINLKETKKALALYQFTNQGEVISDFIEVLNNNYNDIVAYKYDGSRIYMHYKQQLLFINDDDWNVIKEGFLSERSRTIRGFVDAIFSRKCTVMFETGFFIDLHDCYAKNYPFVDFTCGVPNPHIHGFDCWGDNRPHICRALEEGKNDIAFEQIKSALAGVDVTDGAVMSEFCRFLNNENLANIPCITDNETGKLMTVREAKDFYKDYDSTKEEEKN